MGKANDHREIGTRNRSTMLLFSLSLNEKNTNRSTTNIHDPKILYNYIRNVFQIRSKVNREKGNRNDSPTMRSNGLIGWSSKARGIRNGAWPTASFSFLAGRVSRRRSVVCLGRWRLAWRKRSAWMMAVTTLQPSRRHAGASDLTEKEREKRAP